MNIRNIDAQKLGEIGWHYECCNQGQAKDLEDFLNIRRSKSHVHFLPFLKNPQISLNFYKYSPIDNEIAHISLVASLDQNKNEYFNFQIASKNSLKAIYNDFKAYFEKLGWDKSFYSVDENNWITYYSPRLSSTTEVEKALQQIEAYKALPSLIKEQIEMGYGSTSLEVAQKISSLDNNNLFSKIKTKQTSSLKEEEIESSKLKKTL